MTAPLRLLHLVGSAVDEVHAELSRVYASDALGALETSSSFVSRIAYVAPDGSWRFPDGLEPPDLEAAAPLAPHEALAHLAAAPPDVLVPQMFCTPGLTSYRALFELLGIPSVGNPASVMASTMDKVVARAIVAAAGVPVPPGQVVRRGDDVTLTPPLVVKPAAADNSVGVSLVRDAAELAPALEQALAHGEVVLVERYIELGRELRCGTIRRDGRLVALPPEEYAVDPTTKPIRDRADKLAKDDRGRLRLVAKGADRAWIVADDDPALPAVQAVARACHLALGCEHHGLVDLRLDPDGQPWFLEAGPYCSFGPSSVVATMARAAGLGSIELFEEAIEDALSRGNRPSTPPS
jgi:D-alanine-D-alanine ligase